MSVGIDGVTESKERKKRSRQRSSNTIPYNNKDWILSMDKLKKMLGNSNDPIRNGS
jgi:hypothetical protein